MHVMVLLVSTNTRRRTMGRTPCCNAEGLKKGAWTADEDHKLIAAIKQHGEGGWRTLPQKAGLSRCGKSCRLRWFNYLSPAIKRGEFTSDEDQTIINLKSTLGNRWSVIAKHLPGRTDNEIKNYWHTRLKKSLPIGPTPLTSNPLTSEEQEASEPAATTFSRSAPLLNFVATNVVPFRRLHAVQSIIQGSSSNSTTPTAPCIDDTDPDMNQKSRLSTSASANLLNKTATRIGSARLGTSVLKSILSSKPAEVGPSRSDCRYNMGSTSPDNLEFLDSLDLFNNYWEAFSPNASECGGASDVSYHVVESNINKGSTTTTTTTLATTVMPKCDNSNEIFSGIWDVENEAFFMESPRTCS